MQISCQQCCPWDQPIAPMKLPVWRQKKKKSSSEPTIVLEDDEDILISKFQLQQQPPPGWPIDWRRWRRRINQFDGQTIAGRRRAHFHHLLVAHDMVKLCLWCLCLWPDSHSDWSTQESEKCTTLDNIPPIICPSLREVWFAIYSFNRRFMAAHAVEISDVEIFSGRQVEGLVEFFLLSPCLVNSKQLISYNKRDHHDNNSIIFPC